MGNIHHAIFVPGLGDDMHMGFQQSLVDFWRHYGVEPHVYPMHWGDGNPFEPKLAGLVKLATDLSAEDDQDVSLVGSSAGGDVALIAFAENQEQELINKVVTLCTPILHLEKIGNDRFEENPDFKEAIKMMPKSLAKLGPNAKRRIQTRRPFWDEVVSPRDAVLEGADQKRIIAAGHAASIVVSLSVGGPSIARFIKSD